VTAYKIHILEDLDMMLLMTYLIYFVLCFFLYLFFPFFTSDILIMNNESNCLWRSFIWTNIMMRYSSKSTNKQELWALNQLATFCLAVFVTTPSQIVLSKLTFVHTISICIKGLQLASIGPLGRADLDDNIV
jgi:hypothetical protein